MTLKSRALSIVEIDRKAVSFSIRDALTYREINRDPGNRDITINDPYDAAPRVGRALQLSTVFACVLLRSNAIATMPLFLYERTETAGRDTRRIARDHELYALLHDSPNADMTAFEFKRSMAIRFLTWGNAYAAKTYNTRGKLVSLDPLDPALLTPKRLPGGARVYLYADPKGEIEFSENEIWHWKGFSEDGLTGLSPIAIGARSMLAARNLGQAGSDLYGKGLKPDAVLSTKELLTKDQRAQMKEKLMGSVFGSDSHRMMLLEATDYKQLTISPRDAQMIELTNASVEDLCRWFGVPPAKIGHGTAVSNWGTGREQQNLGFLQEVLDPDLVMIEQSIAKSLLTPVDRLRYFAEFGRESSLRMDSASRAEFYSKMTQNGIYTRNFCRALENLEPLPGGDDLTVQSNLIPLNKLGEVTSAADNATIAQDNGTTTP